MEIFGNIDEADFILEKDENFTENYQNDFIQSREFELSLQRSSWEVTPKKRENTNCKPSCLEEIHLYNPSKPMAENFNDGNHSKYLLVKAKSNGDLCIENRIPDQFSKVVVNLNTIEEYSVPEMFIIDYDTIFGVRLTSFIKYDNKFFTCDERVFFETLLIKYKSFSFKPFYWSREKMWSELGIKKDRAGKIIDKLKKLEFISTQVKKRVINNRPQQVTYFDLNSTKIIESLPKIFSNKHDIDEPIIISELKKYLNVRNFETKNILK